MATLDGRACSWVGQRPAVDASHGRSGKGIATRFRKRREEVVTLPVFRRLAQAPMLGRMDHADQRHPVARKQVVLRPADGFRPHVRAGVDYVASADGSHTLDLYYPVSGAEPRPAVIFVSGLSDVGA